MERSGSPKRPFLPLVTEAEHAELEDSVTYRPWVVARYPHWTLYLHEADQGLPGRMRVWLKRHLDEMDVSELKQHELDEFHYAIMPAIKKAVQTLWPCVRLNHEWLGNETHQHRGHGHYHVTPRYYEPFKIGRRTFTDENCRARRQTPKLQLPEGESKHILRLIRATEPFEHFPR
ncbi:MAG: hypothetical protein JWL88_697 [Parcubacteria group bacterium]|nr:hypothetical protein [Parcubacteria group bacterium]